jgi:hypothetical protein
MLLLRKLTVIQSSAYKEVLFEDFLSTKTGALQILVEFLCSLHSWVCSEFWGWVVLEQEALLV